MILKCSANALIRLHLLGPCWPQGERLSSGVLLIAKPHSKMAANWTTWLQLSLIGATAEVTPHNWLIYCIWPQLLVVINLRQHYQTFS